MSLICPSSSASSSLTADTSISLLQIHLTMSTRPGQIRKAKHQTIQIESTPSSFVVTLEHNNNRISMSKRDALIVITQSVGFFLFRSTTNVDVLKSITKRQESKYHEHQLFSLQSRFLLSFFLPYFPSDIFFFFFLGTRKRFEKLRLQIIIVSEILHDVVFISRETHFTLGRRIRHLSTSNGQFSCSAAYSIILTVITR